jgi:hypothetical protein
MFKFISSMSSAFAAAHEHTNIDDRLNGTEPLSVLIGFALSAADKVASTKVGRLATQVCDDYMPASSAKPHVADLIDFSEEPIVNLYAAITIIEEYDPSVVPAAN